MKKLPIVYAGLCFLGVGLSTMSVWVSESPPLARFVGVVVLVAAGVLLWKYSQVFGIKKQSTPPDQVQDRADVAKWRLAIPFLASAVLVAAWYYGSPTWAMLLFVNLVVVFGMYELLRFVFSNQR